MELNNALRKLKSISIRRYYSHLLAVVVGFVFGVLSIEDKEEEVKIKYETKHVPFKEFVFIDVPKPIYLRDTIINEVKYPVNVFEGVQKTEFGDLGYKASTAGHLLDLEFKPDFKIPVTSTIIEKKIERSSLYANASYTINNHISVGLTFVHKKWELGYSRGFDNSNTIRIGRRIF
jgi:hypothetical protein